MARGLTTRAMGLQSGHVAPSRVYNVTTPRSVAEALGAQPTLPASRESLHAVPSRYQPVRLATMKSAALVLMLALVLVSSSAAGRRRQDDSTGREYVESIRVRCPPGAVKVGGRCVQLGEKLRHGLRITGCALDAECSGVVTCMHVCIYLLCFCLTEFKHLMAL